MDKDIAIQVKNVGKTFRIPHEKVDSLRGAFVGALKGKRTFEEFKALDDVSFEVKKGEFFGIIGRNGSGKSTLLKILAGIYQADKGSVRTNGLISPFLELGIGFNPELSGRDNIYLNATVLGLTKKEIDEKFDSIVAFSELERFIDQKLKNYSSGMQVRLAFSVSIHANRDILLMDEVLAVGDSNFQAKCLEEFVKYKEMGKTVILVTHDIATVQRYCDRAMLLRNGEIVSVGKADEIGDEYVVENISDEEDRLQSEKIREGKDSSTADDLEKRAEIIEVFFTDDRGESRAVFMAGDDICLKIRFRINEKDAQSANIGVGLHSTVAGAIFGYNTQIDGCSAVFGRGIHETLLRLHDVPLLQGDYFVNVTLFGKSVSQIYDFRPKAARLRMQSTGARRDYGGILDIRHKWEV